MEDNNSDSSVFPDDRQSQGEALNSWNNLTYDKETDQNSHENRRGRPKAASITNLMMEGAKSLSSIKCKYCGRVFPREKSLQAHHRIHTGERPYPCNYPGCLRAFTQSGQLKTHQRLHTGEKPFICSFEGCGNRFTHANRHCPAHPDSVLTRSDGSVLRPVFLNPIHSDEVNDWLEQYKKDRKTQQEIVNRKQKNPKQRNEEVENNDVKLSIRKVKHTRIKDDQIKRSKNNCTVVKSRNPTECNCTGIIPPSYNRCTESTIQKHDKSYEQKIELPKKRWLREASQDQSLKDLNQSRPTVLMIAGKENEEILLSSSYSDESVMCKGTDNDQNLLQNPNCDNIKSEEFYFEDCCSSTPLYEGSNNLPSVSGVENLFRNRIESVPDFPVIPPITVDQKVLDENYFDERIVPQNRIPFKKLRCDTNINEIPNYDVPCVVKNENEQENLFKYSDISELPQFNETLFDTNNKSNASSFSVSSLSPSLIKPYPDIGCSTDSVVNVLPQRPLVPNETIHLNFSNDNNSDNIMMKPFQEFSYLDNLHYDRNYNICNTPELNITSLSHTPPTPSKWNYNPSVSRSTPTFKMSSAYKKRMHNRFLSQFNQEESHSLNNQLMYPSNIKQKELMQNVIVNQLDVPKSITEEINYGKENYDNTEEELALPLTPVPVDSKPLNLSSSSNEYLDL